MDFNEILMGFSMDFNGLWLKKREILSFFEPSDFPTSFFPFFDRENGMKMDQIQSSRMVGLEEHPAMWPV